MDRNDPTIVIQNQKFNFNEIVNSLIELNRFPVLIVLDNKKALEQLPFSISLPTTYSV